MVRFLLSAAILLGFGLLIYFGRYVPSPEEEAFDKKFDQESVLLKTCGTDPGVASGAPMRVYRYENKLWYRDVHRWRQVDASPENVCDLLDIDKGHREQR